MTVYPIQYKIKYVKKQGKLTHKKEKNHTIAISPEMTEIISSPNKNFKTLMRNMLKDLKKNMNIYG